MFSEAKLKTIEGCLTRVEKRCEGRKTSCQNCNVCPTFTGLIAEIRRLRKEREVLLSIVEDVKPCSLCVHCTEGMDNRSPICVECRADNSKWKYAEAYVT